LADPKHGVGVSVPVSFEISAQIKEWIGQGTSLAEQQRYQQSAYTTVAVQERVDGFELVRDEGELHKNRQRPGFAMNRSKSFMAVTISGTGGGTKRASPGACPRLPMKF